MTCAHLGRILTFFSASFQNHHQHSPDYIAEMLGMHGYGGLPKLPMEGKCYDMILRIKPHHTDNGRRFKKVGKNMWYDKCIVCVLKHNEHFQDLESQVCEFGRAIVAYLLDETVRSVLIDGMRNGMSSHKLVDILAKDDADYWKMLRSVEPMANKIASLDEVLIKCLVRRLLKCELKSSSEDLDDRLKRALYLSGEFPSDIQSMFEEE